LSFALSTAAAIRVVRVIIAKVSAARSEDARMAMRKAQRKSIGGNHIRFKQPAKGFLRELSKPRGLRAGFLP